MFKGAVSVEYHSYVLYVTDQRSRYHIALLDVHIIYHVEITHYRLVSQCSLIFILSIFEENKDIIEQQQMHRYITNNSAKHQRYRKAALN